MPALWTEVKSWNWRLIDVQLMLATEGGIGIMYNVKTLDGINDARNDIFNKAMLGEIPESRAALAEKMCRGAKELNGDLRLKALAMVAGNKKFEPFAAELAQGVTQFVNGPASLPDRT